MITVTTIPGMQNLSRKWSKEGKTIAFVPTMGYLHKGHVSLIEIAKKHADVTVVSIFVNPTQFGPDEDLAAYPRDFSRDKKICADLGVSAIFSPDNKEMYSEKFSTWVSEEEMSKGLCGRSRPNHFKGVTTVVSKLFLATFPDIAVFGQKDAQQALVIKKMVKDLNFPIEIIIGPTIREKDGLAMSSRNKYLNREQRVAATAIYQSLKLCQIAFEKGETNVDQLKQMVKNNLIKSGGNLDYVQCVSAETLAEVSQITNTVLLAVAASYGSTRLIDNCFLGKRNG